MSNPAESKARRAFLRNAAMAAVSAPIAFQLITQRAHAQDKPMLPLDNPQAVALGYADDAAKVDSAKHPQFKAGSSCANCNFAQGSGDPLGCMLFPANSVAAKGWCASWAPKAG